MSLSCREDPAEGTGYSRVEVRRTGVLVYGIQARDFDLVRLARAVQQAMVLLRGEADADVDPSTEDDRIALVRREMALEDLAVRILAGRRARTH